MENTSYSRKHLGGNVGKVHNTYFWIDLKKRITAVALMQILPIGDPWTAPRFDRTGSVAR